MRVITRGYYRLLLPITMLRLCAFGAGRSLQDMNSRNHKNQTARMRVAPVAFTGRTLLESILLGALVVMALATISPAAELPEAPSAIMRTSAPMITPTVSASSRIAEGHTINKTFLGLAFVSSASTIADSYTTLFARKNWLAGKKGVCNMEVQSAYLYGTHPTVGRAYAVASAKSVGSIFAAYYMRKHHSRFWSFPLVANSLVSLEGVTQNMIECN